MRRKKLALLTLASAATISLWGCGSNLDSGGDQTVQTPTAADPQALFAASAGATGPAGSAVCQTCHQTIYDAFAASGHPFKLNKVENGQIPTYPFSTIAGALEQIADDNDGTDNSRGTPASYEDVSYVIGGYGWKARWIDLGGYIVTGSAVQYNLENGAMAGYHNEEIDKKYNCGNCHVTGWRHYDTDLNPNRQDDLAGMDGTFVAPGIQCESCHGPGNAHVASQSKNDIVRIATARTTSDFLEDDMGYGEAVACSECHTRDGEKDYPTYVSPFNVAFPAGPQEGGRINSSNGLLQHHEQYDEMLGVNPDAGNPLGKHLAASVTCISCHDPHKTVKYQDQAGESGLIADCDDCHGAGKPFEVAIPADSNMADLDCLDCHMPLLAKSAVAHAAVGSGPVTGDIKTHIFKIDLSKTAQFTADGKYAYPWITKNFACLTCHNGVDQFDLAAADLSAYQFHKATTAEIAVAALAADFAGAAACAGCHPDYYSDFSQSGHPFKLNKVVNDQVPAYPFSTIDGAREQIADDNDETDNTLGTPASYADVTYVIGGYGWKARWIDLDGYIVTGSAVQYNLASGAMAGYHNDEVDKKYNCGNCHTTGWQHYDANLNPNRQDDLPGMDGTFAAAGIQCESCHGAGLRHVASGGNPAYVVRNATARTTADFLADDMAAGLPVACSECHTRDGEKDYSTFVSPAQNAGYSGNEGGRIIAKGGFAQHHEQYDELLGLDPDNIAGGPLGKHLLAGISCISCHDPHRTTKYQDDVTNTSAGPGVIVDCTDCHTVGFSVAVHGLVADCIDCHMPKAAKSAITTDSRAGGLGVGKFGDIRSHIFKIDLSKDPATEQFSGSYMKPWLARDFACGTCHANTATRVGNLPGGVVHP